MTTLYIEKKIRFRPEEAEALDKLKKPNETERELILRLANITAKPILRGRPPKW